MSAWFPSFARGSLPKCARARGCLFLRSPSRHFHHSASCATRLRVFRMDAASLAAMCLCPVISHECHVCEVWRRPESARARESCRLARLIPRGAYAPPKKKKRKLINRCVRTRRKKSGGKTLQRECADNDGGQRPDVNLIVLRKSARE